MGGAEDVTPTADLGFRITKGLRERSREHYECDLCGRVYSTEPGLWAHTKDSHSEVCPEDEYDQQQLRAYKKELCYRKSDTARHEPQQPLPPNQLPTPVRWQVLDMAPGPRASKPDPEDPGGLSRGVFSSDVHEIERGTSHITLHQPDTSLLVSGRPNARKRNGPDSPAEYPAAPIPPSANVSRDDQSPKRSRPQPAAPSRRTLGHVRGNLTSAIKRLSGAGHPDPEFDRSRYQADLSPTNEEGTRPAVPTRRLYDPDSDLPSAPRVDEEYSGKRLDESTTVAHRPYSSRTKREPKKRGLVPSHGQRFTQLKPATPPPQQTPPSREGGQMMILKLGGQHSQPPQQLQTYPGKGEDIRMVPQPETRPISPEQLIAEVKGIYAGLVMVEAKCSEVDAKQTAACHDGYQPKLNNEQWQALIALHRTLLHEHHDFFLASQHPSASPSLRRLAPKYSMPARMWKHGIFSFLELLRYRLPHSREHMLTFIYIAYSMMALLYETVSAFEDTWIECLGDLGRYRMGIEDNDDYDREVWASVSGSWYSKAADKMPHVGRLYHHLAILAEPNILDQLFYYCKSLGVSNPFHPARESILTLFDPIFSTDNTAAPQSTLVDTGFIQLHGINFTHIGLERFNETLFDYLDVLDKHIGNPQSEWKVPGCYMAACNIVGLYQYGAKDSLLRLAWREGRSKQNPEEEMEDAPPASQCGDGDTGADFDALLPPIPSGASSEHVTSLLPPRSKLKGGKFYEGKTHQKTDASAGVDSKSWNGTTSSLDFSKRLAYAILGVALERTGDPNVLPHIHVWLVFLAYITCSAPAMLLLENEFPWRGLVYMLNNLVAKYECDRFEDDGFPVPEKGVWRALPEDYTLRGLDWAKKYFPDSWFQRALVGDEERSMELPSMENIRIERILWLATRIAANGEWLAYSSRRFEVHPALLHRIQEHQKREALIAQELEASRMTPTLDDSDIEMASGGNDSDGDYVLVGESEEFRRLKQKKLQLQSQLHSQLNAAGMSLDSVEETKQTTAKGPEALRPDYTVLVVDTNLLLSHPDAFDLMVSTNNWPVVIPNTVITELLGLTHKPDSIGDAAKRAIISINEAVTEKRDVKVVTAKGNNVTNIGFYKEQLDKQGDEEFRNIDDIIILTAKQQGEARRQAIPGNFGDSEPSVLVTEDRNMRVKANARGVTAIAASVLKRTLARHAERSNSVRLKRKSFVAPVPGPQEPAEDEVLVFPGGSAPSNSISSHELFSQSQMASRRKKRLHKRGRTEGTDINASGIN